MNPDDVADWLKQNPEFFGDYADQMTDMLVPHPHGDRAISLIERQMIALRDKNRMLEDKLRELITFGEENDAIGDKMHRLSLALLGAREVADFLYAISYNLREDFAVPHVAMRVWQSGAGGEGMPEFLPVTDELRAAVDALTHPACGPTASEEAAGWFGEARPLLRSYAMVPLRRAHAVGVLVLASEDPGRFYPEMGTLYLQRLGDMAGAGLARFAE